jgi:hypothetical protein
VKGRDYSVPFTRTVMSPGRRPSPNRRPSHGETAVNTTSAIRSVNNHFSTPEFLLDPLRSSVHFARRAGTRPSQNGVMSE